MPPLRSPLAMAALLLAGCAQVPLAEAEAQCARAVVYGGGSDTAVTVGIGTGSGGWGWGWGGSGLGAGVALSTTLPVRNPDPAAEYDACVYRKSGQPPLTPFAQRPELRP